MLSSRQDTILKSIVMSYITKARPVPSQSIMSDCHLNVSSATIRNEMVCLEDEGYIARPHSSAGGIPLDKGYRHYVESIGNIKLPEEEQRLISHLFHQIESDVDEWLTLAARIVSQRAQNAVVVTMAKAETCQFKYLELVGMEDTTVLLILALSGATVRKQLLTFDQKITQAELTVMANKLIASYAGLTSAELSKKGDNLSPVEQRITGSIIELMKAEDNEEFVAPYLDGLHFTLNQPEFSHDNRTALLLMELIEQHNLLKSIMPPGLTGDGVRVIIGSENRSESIRDYSVVISQYGLPEEAVGTIGVIGPTRMPYDRTIATVDYLASVLSELVARLYKKKTGRTKTEKYLMVEGKGSLHTRAILLYTHTKDVNPQPESRAKREKKA